MDQLQKKAGEERKALNTKIQELEHQLAVYKGSVAGVNRERLVRQEDGFAYLFDVEADYCKEKYKRL